MTDTTISSSSSSARTLQGTDRLFITGTGQLKPSGPAITWSFSSPSPTGVLVDNSGIIAPTSGRAIDTSNSAAGSATSFTLINRSGASIASSSTLMRVQKSISGGDITVDNSGSLQATADRAFNIQEYVGVQHFTLTNRAGATIQSTDDTLRFTTSNAGAVTSSNSVFSGQIAIDNSGTIKSVGAGSGQVFDFNDINATALGHVSITNRAGGVIEAADADAIRGSRFAQIDNYGTIQSKNANSSSSGNDAIDFQTNDGGVINNYEGGQIIGARHGITGDKPITVTNDGTITGQLGSGINLDSASTTTATIVNQVHGTISGTAGGSTDGDAVDVDGLANITNAGVIQALGHATSFTAPDTAIPKAEAIAIGGGQISNQAGGQIISSERAITVDDSNTGNAFAAVSITNAGTITGSGGEAIKIIGTFGDTLTNGGTINGSIDTGNGNDTITNSGTLNGALFTGAGDDAINLSGTAMTAIDGGTGYDTITTAPTGAFTDLIFSNVTNVEALHVNGGFVTITDNESYSGGVTIAQSAVLSIGAVNGTTGSVSGAVVNDGALAIVRSGGTVLSGAISGNGVVDVYADTTLQGDNSYAGGTYVISGTLTIGSLHGAGNGGIFFTSAAQNLRLEAAAFNGGDFATVLHDFGKEDSVDLRGIGTATGASLGAGNVLTVNGTASQVTLHLDPAQDYSSYRFHVASDGAGGTLVSYADDVAPVAQADMITTNEDMAIVGTVSASDAEGDTLGYALATGPAHGALVFGADGAYTYTPDADFNGNDSFSFIANDGTLDSAPASVSIAVASVNDAPMLTGVQATLANGTEDVAYIVSSTSLLTGFSDNDSDPLSVANLTASNGTIADNGDGTYTITPSANFNGGVTLSYDVVDNQGGTLAATLGYTLASVNDAPDAISLQGGTIAENSTNGSYVGTFTGHDADGEALSYTLTNTAGGRFALNAATGVLTVANGAALDYETATSHAIAVHVTDGSGAGFDQNFNITLSDVSEARIYTGTASTDTFVAPTSLDGWTVDSRGGNDHITTSNGNDTIASSLGNDTISAGGGDDLITFKGAAANSGLDVIDGGAGFDELRALSAYTVFSFDSLTGIEKISAGNFAGVTIGGGTGADHFDFSTISLAGISAIHGGAGNDAIIGSAGLDIIWGDAGDDSLAGGDGGDLFMLGLNAGFDSIDGGAGFDTLKITANNVKIGLAAVSGLEMIDGGGFANVSIIGKTGADMLNLTGISTSGIAVIDLGSGNDTLIGSDSADVIRGGVGADVYTGGVGADIFRYATPAEGKAANIDLITDFTVGEDRIDLSALDASSKIAGNQAFAFIGGDAFHKVAGELRADFDGTANLTKIFADFNGDARADFEIHLQGNVPLSQADIIL